MDEIQDTSSKFEPPANPILELAVFRIFKESSEKDNNPLPIKSVGDLTLEAKNLFKGQKPEEAEETVLRNLLRMTWIQEVGQSDNDKNPVQPRYRLFMPRLDDPRFKELDKKYIKKKKEERSNSEVNQTETIGKEKDDVLIFTAVAEAIDKSDFRRNIHNDKGTYEVSVANEKFLILKVKKKYKCKWEVAQAVVRKAIEKGYLEKVTPNSDYYCLSKVPPELES